MRKVKNLFVGLFVATLIIFLSSNLVLSRSAYRSNPNIPHNHFYEGRVSSKFTNPLRKRKAAYTSNPNIPHDHFYEGRVSTKFTNEEQQQIWKALAAANRLVQQQEFEQCLRKYVTRNTNDEGKSTAARPPGVTETAYIIGIRVDYFKKVRPAVNAANVPAKFVYINRLEDIYPDKKGSKDILGRAGVKTNFPEEGFKITLNQGLFGEYPGDSLWAGVILHETDHNMGYNHSKKDGKFDGSYIYEAGWCLERENSDKSFGLNGEVRGGVVVGD